MPRPFAHRPRRRRRAVAATLTAVAVIAAPAQGGDRRITGSISQSVLGDTNVQLDRDSGGSLGSITRLGLSYSDRTPTAALSLGTAFSYSAFTGSDNDNISGLYPSLNGSYVVRRSTQSLGVSFNASWRPVDFFRNTALVLDPLDPGDDDPVDPGDGDDGEDPGDGGQDPIDPGDPGDGIDDIPPDERGRARDEGERITFGAGINYNAQLTARDNLFAGFNATRVDYINTGAGANLIPYTRFSFNTGLRRTFRDRLNGGLVANASYYMEDGGRNREVFSFALTPTASYRRTPRESYTFTLGPSFNYETFDLAGGGQDSNTSISLRGAIGATYAGDWATYAVNLSQSLQPASRGGELVNYTRLSFTSTRRLTQTSSLNGRLLVGYKQPLDDSSNTENRTDVLASLNFQQRVNTFNSYNLGIFFDFDGEDPTDEATVGLNAGWNYRIAQRTTARIGYTGRLRSETGGGGDDFGSHRIQLTLSHGFTLLP